MKPRTKDYIERRKARRAMLHPDDLRSFLIAEYNSSRNILVKKDIKKMIDTLGAEPVAGAAPTVAV